MENLCFILRRSFIETEIISALPKLVLALTQNYISGKFYMWFEFNVVDILRDERRERVDALKGLRDAVEYRVTTVREIDCT
jgi:hypothetical protein